MTVVETDYLVIGAGATGLAFADTLLDETDAHITVVDRRGAPGGHWNDAYPFVTLHQPSAFYGVNSLELGTRRKDTAGLNQGMYELASGAEITAYYDRVVRTRLLPSGRVDHNPLSEYEAGADGGHRFRNLLSGATTEVRVRRKVVDSTYSSPSVPSTHRPRFTVAGDVRLVPPNALPGLAHRAPPRFVVLGGGKTAMDTCVWLVQHGADPDAITWVVPRDSWLINRVTTQPGAEFFHEAIGGQADQLEALATATGTEDLFLRLERAGILTRIDRDRLPGMFHLATVAPGEVEVLRRIRDVVRLGRVRELHPDAMVLDEGTVAVAPGTVFVDCTASAVEPRPVQPVFQGDRIALQLVRLPQPAFSAALTAWVEAHHDDDETKNRLCGTVPFPHTLDDYPATMLATMWNQYHWGQDPQLRRWIRASRLDGFGKLMAEADRDDPEQQAVLARIKQHAVGAVGNLTRLVEARSAPA
jgi:hypothetical protein